VATSAACGGSSRRIRDFLRHERGVTARWGAGVPRGVTRCGDGVDVDLRGAREARQRARAWPSSSSLQHHRNA